MATEVLLITDVENLGKEGDVVRVKDGYARNFLFPNKLAAPVTDATRRRLEKIRRDRAAVEAATLADARALADRIAQASVQIKMKTGEDGKLFGAVTTTQVVDALALQGITVDRHQIEMPEALRELGVFSVPVTVHPQVTATLKVWVSGE